MKRFIISGLCAFVLLLIPAAVPGADMDGNKMEVQNSSKGIPYVSGGIGTGERDILKKMMPDFNLKLVFALEDGSYLSGCSVQIYDHTGKKVLSSRTEGPWMLADLPGGQYRIKAGYENGWQTQTVTVTRTKLLQIFYHW